MKSYIFFIALLFSFFPTANVTAVTTVHQDSYSSTSTIFTRNLRVKPDPKKKRRRKKGTGKMERTTKIFRTIFFGSAGATLLGAAMYIGGVVLSANDPFGAGILFAVIGLLLFWVAILLSIVFGALWLAFWIASQDY